MPYLSVNFAISADGKISGASRQPSGWTSEADSARLIALRRPADALLVGRGTLEADRMTMTVPGAKQQPLRCIVSRSGKLDEAHPIFTRDGGPIHLLVPGNAEPDVPDCVTIHCGTLKDFLAMLVRDYAVRHIHCEGGGELVQALAEDDLIDEIHLTWAGHTLFSGRGAPTLTGVPGDFLPSSRAFDLTHFEPLANVGECFMTWKRNH